MGGGDDDVKDKHKSSSSDEKKAKKEERRAKRKADKAEKEVKKEEKKEEKKERRKRSASPRKRKDIVLEVSEEDSSPAVSRKRRGSDVGVEQAEKPKTRQRSDSAPSDNKLEKRKKHRSRRSGSSSKRRSSSKDRSRSSSSKGRSSSKSRSSPKSRSSSKGRSRSSSSKSSKSKSLKSSGGSSASSSHKKSSPRSKSGSDDKHKSSSSSSHGSSGGSSETKSRGKKKSDPLAVSSGTKVASAPAKAPVKSFGTKPQMLDRLTHTKFSRSIAAATPASYYRCGSSDLLFKNIEQAKKQQMAVIRKANDPVEIPDRVLTDVPYPETEKLAQLRLLGDDVTLKCEPADEWKAVRDHLHREGRMEKSAALRLIGAARAHLLKQPNMLELSPPLTLCGDIHGQFYDLCRLIEEIGNPEGIQYLFLGDYVDRGDFSTEVCFFLFSMMLSYPKTFFMLRGNHECRLLTTNFNFRRECYCKYDEEVYDAFMDCFDALPIAALITSDVGGVEKRYFACHGGLSPDLTYIDQVKTLDRVAEPDDTGILCDLLWSDPVPEDETVGMDAKELEEWRGLTYRPNVTRGCAWEFGAAAVEKFVKDNNIDCILRAHEVKRVGYEEHFFHEYDSSSPNVITVFSAPNYCDMYENRAAFLNIFSTGEYKFGQIGWASHPYCLPNFDDVFTFSYPFIQECAAQMYVDVLDWLGVSEEDKQKLVDVSETYSTIQARRKTRQQRITAIKTVLLSSGDGFDQAMKIDQTNERRPGMPNMHGKKELTAREKFAENRANTLMW